MLAMRIRSWLSWRYLLVAWTAWIAASAALAQPTGSRHYLYLSDKRIVTVELIDPQNAILNYFNLDDSIVFVRAPHMVIRDASGNSYRGHVIQLDDPPSPDQQYSVSEMVQPRTYAGFTILGNFNFEAPPSEAYLRIGGRIVKLEALTEQEFDVVASRVGDLDLTAQNTALMIEFAGFRSGHGELFQTSDEKAAPLLPLFPELDLLPPVLISEQRPGLPDEFDNLPDPVIVQLTASVGRSGGLYKVEVKKGLNKKLDRIAVEFVQNTWKLLPAISKGEVASADTTLNVVFER